MKRMYLQRQASWNDIQRRFLWLMAIGNQTSDNIDEAVDWAAMSQLQLSARAYHRILKLARTIADLAGSEEIQTPHVAEALYLRQAKGDDGIRSFLLMNKFLPRLSQKGLFHLVSPDVLVQQTNDHQVWWSFAFFREFFFWAKLEPQPGVILWCRRFSGSALVDGGHHQFLWQPSNPNTHFTRITIIPGIIGNCHDIHKL